jgi:SNF2 family DNA or RNA helicase
LEYSMTFIQPLRSWKPRVFQEQAVKLGVSQACAGFLAEPGMGKTTITYAITQVLRKAGLIKRVLVLAPLRVIYNVWPVQCGEWQEFSDLKVAILHGKDKDKRLADPSYDIYCMNFEGLPWLTGAKTVGNRMVFDPTKLKFIREHFDMLVIDESTKVKDTGTNRFKMVRQFIKGFKRRYILTGTIAPNGLLDLFGQIYVLDEGASLGQYITGYKNKYFYPTDHMGYNLAPHEWAAEEIARKIAPLTLVLKRSEHLDMPELIFNDIKIDLPAPARKLYDAMYGDLIVNINDDNIIAANAAVATSKCRQVANGGLYKNGSDREWEDIHNEKLEALSDLLDQLTGCPVLIAFEFELLKIQEKLKIPAIGRGSPAKDAQTIAAFNAGLLPAVLGHPASIALGLNLQGACSHVVWYGLTWNLEQYLQTIDRVYRQGQRASTVVVHRIIAKGTLDERVLKVLDAKEKTQSDFLDLLKGMRQPIGKSY